MEIPGVKPNYLPKAGRFIAKPIEWPLILLLPEDLKWSFADAEMWLDADWWICRIMED